MLKIYTVKGNSMNPTLKNGQRILATTLTKKIKENNIIIFKRDNKNYIKRIKKIQENKIIITTDNKKKSEWEIKKEEIKAKKILKL